MTEGRTLLTCGEHAVLVEVAGLEEVLALAQAVREAVAAGSAGFTDIVDIVPAARTVLVVVRDDAPMGLVRQALSTLPDAQPDELPSSGETLEVPVHYDGPDLAEVAKLTGLSCCRGHRCSHRDRVESGIRWLRTRLRLPEGRRPATRGSAA